MTSLEINAKYPKDIDNLLPLIIKNGIREVHFVDRIKQLDNILLANEVIKYDSKVDVVLNFSVQNHYHSKSEVLVQNFLEYMQTSSIAGFNKFLIISGTNKRSLRSYDLLNGLSKLNLSKYKPEFFCAYNPYYSDLYLEKENQKLVAKLQTGLISRIYLPIGTNLESLRSGYKFIRQQDKHVQIYGCLMIPNTMLLKRLKRKRDKDLFLTKEYINNLSAALDFTTRLYEVYKEFEINPLIEVSPLTYDNLNSAFNFLYSLKYNILL